MCYSHSSIYCIAIFVFLHHFSTLYNLESKAEQPLVGFQLSVQQNLNHSGQSQTKTTQGTNQNSKQIHVTDAKRGKTRATKSTIGFSFALPWVPEVFLLRKRNDERAKADDALSRLRRLQFAQRKKEKNPSGTQGSLASD